MTETLSRPDIRDHSSLIARAVVAQGERITAGFGVRAPALGAIPLTGGIPAREALPIAALGTAFQEVLTSSTASAALQYSVPLGIPELRDWIAAREQVDAAQVVVTNGALHALSLTFAALLDPGDLVLVENPTFPIALRVLQYHNAHIRSVPVDDDGLDVDALEELLRSGVRPKIVYTIPDFHNPTGFTLPADRRQRLVELAAIYGFVVVADSPYQELRFAGTAVDGVDVESDLVVRANTFSKTLGPGLRLGWAVLPTWLVPAVSRIRQNNDQHASLLTQRAVSTLLAVPGQFDRIAADAAALYRERSSVLIEALERETAGTLLVPAIEGGIFLWGHVQDPSIDVTVAHQHALRLGTDFLPGHYFDSSASGLFTDRIRFGFSNVALEQLPIAAGRVAQALSAAAGTAPV